MPVQPLNGGKSHRGVRAIQRGVKGIAHDGIRRGFQGADGCHGLGGCALTIDQLDQAFHGGPF
jgi:hypothetical protein